MRSNPPRKEEKKKKSSGGTVNVSKLIQPATPRKATHNGGVEVCVVCSSGVGHDDDDGVDKLVGFWDTRST